VRAKGVTQATNAVVHPWLKQQVSEILAALPPVWEPQAALRPWETWGWDAVRQQEWGLDDPLPPIRLILIWDNLTGHKNRELVQWLVRQGVLPLYTPIGGVLAELGGVGATDCSAPSALGTASPERRGGDGVAGSGGGGVEPAPHSL